MIQTEAPATNKQLWYLHLLTKTDTRGSKLSFDEVSILIDYFKGQSAVKKLQNGHSYLCKDFNINFETVQDIESAPQPAIEQAEQIVKESAAYNNPNPLMTKCKCKQYNHDDTGEIIPLNPAKKLEVDNFKIRLEPLCDICLDKIMKQINNVDAAYQPERQDYSYYRSMHCLTDNPYYSMAILVNGKERSQHFNTSQGIKDVKVIMANALREHGDKKGRKLNKNAQ